MKTIITNVIVVTMDVQRNVYTEGYVKIEGTKITEVGPAGSLKDTKEELERTGWEIRDGQRGILMPGMINTHCHLGMIPFRGLGDDCKDRLRVFLLPMEQKAMDRDMAALSSRYAICELLLCGVTTVMDMYYFEESVAAVMDQTGIRGIAGQTVMDEGGCDAPDADTALGKARELIEAYKHHPRISGCAAPHATNTCSPQSLKKAWEMDRRNHVPFTLHAAEMDYELTWLAKTFGCTPIEYLDRTGVLDSHTAAAHGIHLTDGDISLLKQKGSGISHCIGSNAKAAKGVAPVLKLLKDGVPVGLGTDGPASGNTLDLFTQMRLCAGFQKNESHDRSAMPAKDIVSMATCQGARVLGLDKKTGSIEPGKEADMVLVETDSLNMFPVYDPYSALVYSAGASNVRDVYVAGTRLVWDKKLVFEDPLSIRKELADRMKQSAFGEIEELHG